MGARIEASIKERGFLRYDFAKRLGIRVSTLYQICRCRRLPTMQIFLKIIELLNVSADELIGRNQNFSQNSEKNRQMRAGVI